MKYTPSTVRRKQSFESLILKCASKRHTAPEIAGGFSAPRFRQGGISAEVMG